MTTVHLQWEVLAAVCGVLTFAIAAVTRFYKRKFDSAVVLRDIRKAVLGDPTDKTPSLAERFADVNNALGRVEAGHHDLRRDRDADRERIAANEGLVRAESRATRHAIRNLQHQLGFVFGRLDLGPVPAQQPDPLDDLERPPL